MNNKFKLFRFFSLLFIMTLQIFLFGCTGKVVLDRIEFAFAPKNVFYVGEEFEYNEFEINAIYSDGSIKKVTDYSVDASKVNINEAGDYEVTVSYEAKTVILRVHYISDPVVNIIIDNPKVVFSVGETFTVGEEMVVFAVRELRGKTVITDYQVDSSKVNIDEPGIYEVTISYGEFTKTYNVEYILSVDGFKLELNEEKTGYIVSAVADYNYPHYVTVPSEYKGIPVVELGDMRELKANYVKVPSSVKVVSEGAFMGNQSIAVVDFTGCEAIIKAAAFYGSDIYAVELGNVTTIEEEAFKDSSLEIVNIPESVKTIGDEAFNTSTLNEVSFTGSVLPTLGNNVFGKKETSEDHIYIYALDSVWSKLFENVSGSSEEIENAKAEIVKNHFGVTYGAYLIMTEEQKEYVGIFTGDAIIYQIGGDQVVVVIDDYATTSYTYSYKGISLYDEEYSLERFVFAINSSTKTVERINPNDKGEYIKDDILYDYRGEDVVYYVSENVVEVIGGTGMGDGVQTMNTRFIIFGDNVTKIGSYAFAFGQLFGVTFGKNVNYLGEAAFFGQQYLQEIIFQNETVPYIGTSAFCYIGQIGIVPVGILSALSQYGIYCKIYVPRDTSSWLGTAYIDPYINALNQSLVGLENAIVKDQSGNPVKYSTGEVTTLADDELYNFNNVFTFEYGKIYMTSVRGGYVYVELNEGTYDGATYKGFAYASISDVVGYTGNESPKKVQILFKNASDEGMRSFTIFGKFNLKEKTFTARGSEAGTYGIYPNEILELDGFGTINYFNTEKGQYTGTYEVIDGVIIVTGIDVITSLAYDEETNTISYEQNSLPAMGSEAGVYFDLANAARIELDGTPFTMNGIRYDGYLKLSYKDETIETGYNIEGKSLIFRINGVQKTFTYSKESETIISGYYDSNYNYYLGFKIVSSNGSKTYTNGENKLVVDGFYSATLNDENYYYMEIEGTDIIILYNNDIAIFITTSGDTYSVNTDPETGVYYVDSSANYRLYLAGSGKLLYFNGEPKKGSYIYNDDTGEIIITEWDGSASKTANNGILKDGFGYIVYDYYGDSYLEISKEPIEKTYSTLVYYTKTGEDIIASSESLTVMLSGNNVSISKYGTPHQIVRLEEFTSDVPFKVTLTEFEPKNLELTITISRSESGLIVSIKAPYETLSFTSEGNTYTLNWIDENHEYAGFYKNESYPTIITGKVTWNTEKTSFRLGNGLDMETGNFDIIEVNNYNSENMSLNMQSKKPISYSSSSGLEYKYYKVNIYSDTELWVSNSNISGSSPEVCTYTTTVSDGITYYHFYSSASAKNVTFKLVDSYFGTEFVVVEEK